MVYSIILYLLIGIIISSCYVLEYGETTSRKDANIVCINAIFIILVWPIVIAMTICCFIILGILYAIIGILYAIAYTADKIIGAKQRGLRTFTENLRDWWSR